MNGQEIPDQWKTGWITPIHKKGSKANCNNYRCITVTSAISRLYGRVLKALIESEYAPIQMEEQAGFRAGRSCVDNMFCITQIAEKIAATHGKLHLTFVDLTKAYDHVPIDRLWYVLASTPINATLINAVKQLYTNTTACVKYCGATSDAFPTTKGLRQGCAISPTLFNIYLQEALKEWRKKCKNMGIPLNETTLYTLHFADDQVVLSQDAEDMEYMTRKLIEQYQEWGLTVNMEKTQYMVIGEEGKDLQLNNGMVIKACEEYTYLGSKIHISGRMDREIQNRITKGQQTIGALNGILWSKAISKKQKSRLYSSIFKSIILYGCETWQINKSQEAKLNTIAMDFLRRSARISRMDKIRNDRIRDIMMIEKPFIEDIQQKQLGWFGHIKRMQETRLPYQILHWQPYEKRKRGRPKTTWESGINKAMSERNLQLGDWTDRRGWKLGTGRRRTL